MKTLFSICCIILLYSCSSHQYYHISATTLPEENEEIIMENDTLKIVYDFNGYGGPVKLKIHNKTEQPMEINWRKSSIIMNDMAFSYFNPNMKIRGKVSTDTTRGIFASLSTKVSSEINGEVEIDEAIEYLPPNSTVVRYGMVLLSRPIENLPFKKDKWLVKRSKRGYSYKYTKIEYSRTGSPIRFRSFLNFTMGKAPGHEFWLDHNFYISEIWKSKKGDSFMPKEFIEKPGIFYF